jgi:taurine dioxygenase
MRRRIAGLVVRHHYGNRDDLDERSRTAASVLSGIRRRKSHGCGTSSCAAIRTRGFQRFTRSPAALRDRAGWARPKARASRRAEGARDAGKYCHTHDYTNGDVVMWDNVQMLHRAPLVDFSRPRTLWRITVKETA